MEEYRTIETSGDLKRAGVFDEIHQDTCTVIIKGSL